MTLKTRFWVWWSFLALLFFTLVSRGAPAPTSQGIRNKYVADDAYFVLVVNVKQIVASPFYTKHYKTLVGDLWKGKDVPEWLKEIGPDLLRDVDRVFFVMGENNYQHSFLPSGFLYIFEGRFTPEKFHARARQLMKDIPGLLKNSTIRGTTAYEFMISERETGFVAMPDGNTAVFAPCKEQVAEAIQKGTGEKNPVFKFPAMKELLAWIDPEDSVQFFAAKELVTTSQETSRSGPGGTSITEKEVFRLADVGIESLRGNLTAGETVRARVTLNTKNREAAKSLLDLINRKLDEGKAEIKKAAKKQKKYAAVLKALESITSQTNGPAIIFEGELGPGAIEGSLKSLPW